MHAAATTLFAPATPHCLQHRRHVDTSSQWQHSHAQASQRGQQALLRVTTLGSGYRSQLHSSSTVTTGQDHFIGFPQSFGSEFGRHHATIRSKRCCQPTAGCWRVPWVLVLVFPEPAADALVRSVGPPMKRGARHCVSCQVVHTGLSAQQLRLACDTGKGLRTAKLPEACTDQSIPI